ncbi:hypothetical protein HMPREF9457_03562 [Dorea formicigenerans 4_6_53AFAA]|nr:hypothetical protein HMPREF9457_03562 [Dorea formicigenerans 4_6_53AFAA]
MKKTKIIFEGEKNMLNMKSGENTDRKELDKQEALDILQNKLNEAEISIQKEGTISAEELEAELQDILLRVEDDVKNERVDSIENTFSDVRKML